MNLSSRAEQYIQLLKHAWSWRTSSDSTRRYLQKLGIEPTPELISFQVNYSGLILTIKNNSEATFKVTLFSKQDILLNINQDFYQVDNRYIFDCGSHSTAQFNFFITDQGELCTWEEDNTFNILYESFDTFIEQYALLNEIAHWQQNPAYYEVLDIQELESIMRRDFNLISECSDQYNSWWTNDKLIVAKGVWLDRPAFYVHVYGRKQLDCDILVEKFRSAGVVK